MVASNRGPYVVRGRSRVRSVSGLVSALEPPVRASGGVWVAWSGGHATPDGTDAAEAGYRWREVHLSAEEVAGYYHGFANRVLWPLCHYFLEKCDFRKGHWETFVRVNRKFAAEILAVADDDDIIWVHDYHLALVPHFLRPGLTRQRLGFFWHIPFPPRDLFQVLPWAGEILRGMLGSDLVGFHSPGYVDNFLSCVRDLPGVRVDRERQGVEYGSRRVLVRAFPAGIDCGYFRALADRSDVAPAAARLRRMLGVERLGLAVDRLDYSKGILERLHALELFWERYPEYRGRVSVIQIAVPSRTEVEAYRALRREVEEAVGRVNGRFSDGHWLPVYYLCRAFTQEELAVYYAAVDVALVTPLRDGLNLVAKEYVATRTDGRGVLVLSRFAGAAEELKEALLVNPYDLEDMVAKIRAAFDMPVTEQVRRMQALQERVRRHDISWWVGSFLGTLLEGQVVRWPRVPARLSWAVGGQRSGAADRGLEALG